MRKVIFNGGSIQHRWKIGSWGLEVSVKASSVTFDKIKHGKADDRATVGAVGITNDSKGTLEVSSTKVDSKVSDFLYLVGR